MGLLNLGIKSQRKIYTSNVTCIYIGVSKIRASNTQVKHLCFRITSQKTHLEVRVYHENSGILSASPVLHLFI